MDPAYLFHVSGGVLASVGRTRSIERVLADGTVSPEQAAKLRLVLDVRTFGEQSMHLKVGASYSGYDDNSNAVAYAVSAARKDRLEAYRWWYPFVGYYDAKGFFDLKLAQREADRLRRQDYDVFLGEVDGFSTLGLFPDPVRASNLRLDDRDLAELILHECTHNTIYKPDDANFNESMATFVGRIGAVRYFEARHGADSPQAAAARQHGDDLAVVDEYVVDLYRRLQAFYDQPISSEEKVAGRAAVFDAQRGRWLTDFVPRLHEPDRFARIADVTLDNAAVLAGTRYQMGLDVYRAVYDKAGGDFAALLSVLADAARQDDSAAYLRTWAAQH